MVEERSIFFLKPAAFAIRNARFATPQKLPIALLSGIHRQMPVIGLPVSPRQVFSAPLFFYALKSLPASVFVSVSADELLFIASARPISC